jgi:hypothetical protein
VTVSEIYFEKTSQDDGGKLMNFSLKDKIQTGRTRKQGTGSSNLHGKMLLYSDLVIFQGYIYINIYYRKSEST